MKKLVLTLLVAIVANAAFSQSINFGIKAGVNFANQALNNPASSNLNNYTGFHAGAILDITLKNISIQPGILFSTKGFTTKSQLVNANQQNVGFYTSKNVLDYVEIPVNILYKWSTPPLGKLFVGGGPYFGYGLSGKVSATNGSEKYLAPSQNPNIDLHFGSGDGDYKNPDYGFNFLAGIELKHNILVDVNYGLGLGNLTHVDGVRINNRVLGVSVGYLFR
jgi:hypothetical protein